MGMMIVLFPAEKLDYGMRNLLRRYTQITSDGDVIPGEGISVKLAEMQVVEAGMSLAGSMPKMEPTEDPVLVVLKETLAEIQSWRKEVSQPEPDLAAVHEWILSKLREDLDADIGEMLKAQREVPEEVAAMPFGRLLQIAISEAVKEIERREAVPTTPALNGVPDHISVGDWVTVGECLSPARVLEFGGGLTTGLCTVDFGKWRSDVAVSALHLSNAKDFDLACKPRRADRKAAALAAASSK